MRAYFGLVAPALAMFLPVAATAQLLIAPPSASAHSKEVIDAAQAAVSISPSGSGSFQFESPSSAPICGIAHNNLHRGTYVSAMKWWAANYVALREADGWHFRVQTDDLALGSGAKCLKQSNPNQKLPANFERMAANQSAAAPDCAKFDREFWEVYARTCGFD